MYLNYVDLFIYLPTYVCMSLSTCLYIQICVCVYVCVCARLFVWLHACVRVYSAQISALSAHFPQILRNKICKALLPEPRRAGSQKINSTNSRSYSEALPPSSPWLSRGDNGNAGHKREEVRPLEFLLPGMSWVCHSQATEEEPGREIFKKKGG